MILNKLKERQDTEHEQSLIRFGLSIFALVFLLIVYEVTGKQEGKFIVLCGAVFYLLWTICSRLFRS